MIMQQTNSYVNCKCQKVVSANPEEGEVSFGLGKRGPWGLGEDDDF